MWRERLLLRLGRMDSMMVAPLSSNNGMGLRMRIVMPDNRRASHTMTLAALVASMNSASQVDRLMALCLPQAVYMQQPQRKTAWPP